MSSTATPLGKPSPHDSAVLHVTGRAQYVDDRPHQRGQLVAFIVGSPWLMASLLNSPSMPRSKPWGTRCPHPSGYTGHQ